MPAIRDYAVTEVTSATTTATPTLPEHENNDILVVFANKDSTTGMTETSGLYTLLNSGDITTTAWSGMYWRRATSASEIPPTFTWTSETADFVIVSVKGAHTTNAPTGYLGSDDSAMPYTQDQAITTPSNNCFVLHGAGHDVGIGEEPYPGQSQIIYAGDAGANGIGVAWAFYPTASSAVDVDFWGRVNNTPTQIHTIVIEDDGSNTEVQGYVDRGTTPCTILDPQCGSTVMTWAYQTSLQESTLMGTDFNKVWYFNASTYADETVDMNDPGTADVTLVVTVGSILYLGSLSKFSRVAVIVSTATSGGTVVWEYWNGAWVTLSGFTEAFNGTGTRYNIIFTPPSDWATTNINGEGTAYYYIRQRVTVAKTTAGVLSQGLINGVGFVYDAITATADAGVNPYHNVSEMTPSSTTYGMGGTEALYSGGLDMTSGYLLGTYMFSSPRDWVDLAFANRIGIGLRFLDTSNYWRMWVIGSKDSPTTYADRRCIYAIQLDQATDTSYKSSGSPTMTAIDTIQYLSCQPYGTMGLRYSMLLQTGTVVLAGGKSTDPLNFDEMINAITSGCCLFPLIERTGSAGTIWEPLQIGGGDPVHVLINLRTFQFPTHADATTKLFNFHVDSNQVGVEFYPKSGNTCKFTNCVFTSDSPYYWRINSSASSGASWDFDGTNISGATVTLKNVMTFTNMGFIGCPTIDVTGCTLDGCSFSSIPSGNNTLTTSASTLIKNSAINVSGVTAGNYWCSTTTPVIFEDNAFTGGGGHAIRITTPGTYAFDGNTFTGFGANGTTGAAIFNDSGGLVTLNVTGGGDTPTYKNGTSASTVVNNAVTLTITVKDSSGTNIENARVLVEADAGGDAPHEASVTISRVDTTATVSHSSHGLSTGEIVIIRGANQYQYNGVFTIAYINANSYSYTVSGSPDTPATGTITATQAFISEMTNASGIATEGFNYTSSQPFTGVARKASAPPYYRDSSFTGTITSAGLDAVVQMEVDQ